MLIITISDHISCSAHTHHKILKYFNKVQINVFCYLGEYLSRKEIEKFKHFITETMDSNKYKSYKESITKYKKRLEKELNKMENDHNKICKFLYISSTSINII